MKSLFPTKRLAGMAAAVLLLIPRQGHAYIDPGTGMTFVSGLGAFILGFFALMIGAIGVTYRRWRDALKRLFSKKTFTDKP